MKHRTAELEGESLDLAAAQAAELVPIPGQPPGFFYWTDRRGHPTSGWWTPCTDWAIGGPIIDRERISFSLAGWTPGRSGPDWRAKLPGKLAWNAVGHTHLVAAMRAFVLAKMGEEVELP